MAGVPPDLQVLCVISPDHQVLCVISPDHQVLCDAFYYNCGEKKRNVIWHN